jgi:hypothetical protein
LIREVVVSPETIVIRGPEAALAETADAARVSEEFELSPIHISDQEWLWTQSGANRSPASNSVLTGKNTGKNGNRTRLCIPKGQNSRDLLVFEARS